MTPEELATSYVAREPTAEPYLGLLNKLFGKFAPYPIHFYIGPGWIPIIEEAHKALICFAPDYKLIQVKEKFGTLRFYADPEGCNLYQLPEESFTYLFDSVVRRLENTSAHTCELCGKFGRLRSKHTSWVHTYCNACEAEYMLRNHKETTDPEIVAYINALNSLAKEPSFKGIET